MNFFEDQRRVRAETRNLVIYYFLAVAFTALLTGFVIVFFLKNNVKINGQVMTMQELIPAVLGVGVLVALLIFVVSLIKIVMLGKGGEYVARACGAQKVDPHTKDPLIQRYINVVHEMSIASGTPIPKIYLMQHETGINAFAAGYDINDAVVAVTRGTLEKLNRDELQGVVAHEFSHIFNGDMKLNIKLIGFLAGLVFITELGRVLARTRSRNSRSNGNQLAAIGLALMLVGGLGYLLASVIKAMISRQREYLADASAVQFTRNPDGIGGALKKIYVFSGHGLLEATKAGEVSHMFFTSALSQMFATHPPLEDRIQRVFPSMNMDRFYKDEVKQIHKELANVHASDDDIDVIPPSPQSAIDNVSGLAMGFNQATSTQAVEKNIDQAGITTDESLKKARLLVEGLPKELLGFLDSVEGSFIILHAFFYDKNVKTWKTLRLDMEKSREIVPMIKKLDEAHRYVVIEKALAQVENLKDETKNLLLSGLKELIKSDKKVTPQEFILYRLIRHKLKPRDRFFEKHLSKRQFLTIKKPLIDLCKMVSEEKEEKFDVKAVSQSLKYLALTKEVQKQQVLHECTKIISHDNKVTAAEKEFIRLVSISINVPMPL
jgi:Zn-dependent protease with chaperone function